LAPPSVALRAMDGALHSSKSEGGLTSAISNDSPAGHPTLPAKTAQNLSHHPATPG